MCCAWVVRGALALGLWSLEFGVHPLAALVSVRIVGAIFGVVGTAGPRQVALSGRQPCQSASRRQPSCGRPTNQAIGRTKGGLNTKVNAWVDGRGGAVSTRTWLRDSPPMCASRKRQRDRHYVARLQWPTKVTTATVFGSSCGVGAVARASRHVATGLHPWCGIVVTTDGVTKWRTCFND